MDYGHRRVNLQPRMTTDTVRTSVFSTGETVDEFRGPDGPVLPGTPTPPFGLAYIWHWDGKYLLALASETRVNLTTIGCYHTFPTKDAAIMYALSVGDG